MHDSNRYKVYKEAPRVYRSPWEVKIRVQDKRDESLNRCHGSARMKVIQRQKEMRNQREMEMSKKKYMRTRRSRKVEEKSGRYGMSKKKVQESREARDGD